MEYKATINGIETNASYTEESIANIFKPLLEKLSVLQKEKGKRILVLLAAPPAAGKSTLLSFLKCFAEKEMPELHLTTIGMDGFHRYQDYLLSHTMVRDGKEITMVDVKGCPETFDLEKLSSYVRRVASGETMGWPDYDRLLHNPVEDATKVDGDIVILEGNYLLLDMDGWRDLKDLADYTVSISADPEDLKKRLLERKMASGTPYDKALDFVERSDLYNARLVLSHMLKADLPLFMKEDGEYVLYQ